LPSAEPKLTADHQMKASTSSLFMLATGAAIVSLTGPIVRVLSVAPTVTAFYRMMFGGAILLLIVLLARERLRLDRHSILLAAAAALSFAFDMTMWNRSIRLVGPGLATILVGCQVFPMAGVGLIFYKEKLTWRLALAVPLAIIGLAMIVGVDWRLGGPAFRLGVVFGLGSAFCYAGYLVALRKLQHGAGLGARVSNMATVSVCCAVFLGIIALTQRESFVIPDAGSLGLLVSLGVIGQVLAWVLMSGGLPRVRHSLASLTLLLQPLLASVWDVLFFNRPTTALQVVGAAVTLGAIYLGTMAEERG
jgi:drug/metabolite transporter (DMT)-like permease